MLSLLDLHFMLCSRDLNVIRTQRIIGFYLNYPQMIEVRKSDGAVSPIIRGAPKNSSRHFIFHRKCVSFE